MANKTFKIPITADSALQKPATAYGSVSGDVTTITSVSISVSDSEWILGCLVEDFPKVTIIDGKQYRWTIKTKKKNIAGNEYVAAATLNIGTKLVINKPFFTIKYGTNPVSEPYESVRSARRDSYHP